MNQQPLVSIITPSFNQAQFIQQTIHSVIKQDYPLVDYVLIDGGSTDGSLDIIEKYANQYPNNIRWVCESDEGQADAINKGFRMATGKIISWLNSDDTYLYKSTLSEVVASFNHYPEADVIYGDAVLIDQDTTLLKVLCNPPFRYDWLLRNCRITQPAAFFRREVIENDVLDTSISIVLDYEYWLRLGRKFVFRHVPRLWATDRNHEDRKILANRKGLIRQRRVMRQVYGQTNNISFRWNRFIDKLRYGVSGRVRGFFNLVKLYRQETDLFVIPLQFDSFTRSAWRQLWKNNRDLF